MIYANTQCSLLLTVCIEAAVNIIIDNNNDNDNEAILWIFSFLCLCSGWAVLLDRSQRKLQLVLLPPALFIPVTDDPVLRQESLEAVPSNTQPYIIYEETTDIWINVNVFTLHFLVTLKLTCAVSRCFILQLATVCLPFLQVHDIFYPFIQTTDDEFTFIWINESKTGFSHLYKITSLLQPGCYNWSEDYQHTEGKRNSVFI